MGYKKMYGDTIEFDQENKYINIPSTSALKFAGTTVGSLASLGSTALTSTAAEVNTLHSSGITNADLIKVHAVTATAAELNLTDDTMATATIAYAAGAANTITATITVKDAAGATIAAVHHLHVFISRDATGATMTTTAASGALTATTGEIQGVLTAKKSVILNTDANGVAVLSLVDTAKTQGERFCVVVPLKGKIVVGSATVTGDYGA